nr:PqqD family protein [Paenalcaligenes hominis]
MTLWEPTQNVSRYEVGEELFLIQTRSGVIHRLNNTGKAVWQLLQQEPLTGQELSEVLAESFDVDLALVQSDIPPLLAALEQAELIEMRQDAAE